LAAGQFNNVYVIDSRNLSTGSGHIVYDAAVMAQQGKDPTEICRTLETTIPKVEASFVIDRLDYLHTITKSSANLVSSPRLAPYFCHKVSK
jgi:fatty acid-binding protein DegV